MKLTVVLTIVASILFAVACGGGKDADAPAVAVKAIAPTDAPEPTSAPNPVSSQSPTPPPISMVLDTVSPELLSCVKTVLGDEQYDAIITGRQDAVAEQLGLVLPCILQYPQESNAIMEMFGLDMGTIMAASTPIPNTARQPKAVTSQKMAQAPKQPSDSDSSDFEGINIFSLPFADFPFSCAEFGKPEFTSAFFPPALITAIIPMGKMAAHGSKHVTPTDHLYIHREFSAGNEDVLSPSDGFIVKIERFPNDLPLNQADESGRWLGDSGGPMVPDYRMIIMHSCTVFTIFIHLGEIAPAITRVVGSIPLGRAIYPHHLGEPIPVKAGEPIGKFGSQSFDWSVHDADVVLNGFVVPEHYSSEPWKIHTVDPFDYYSEPIRTELLAKVIRETEPRAGKIDYDIEGKIVGNWFIDGSVDYSGSGQPELGYTKGHLAIAYGYIDSTQLRVSIGADTGIDEDLCRICFGTYGIRGNQPDPATVGKDFGLVKYELMSREEESQLIRERVGDVSLGTFLVQHLGNRNIQVEIIPGKTPDQISEFTDKAVIYRR